MTYQELLTKLAEKEKGCNKSVKDERYPKIEAYKCGENDLVNGMIEVCYCPTCQAEISTLKKGIQACEEIRKDNSVTLIKEGNHRVTADVFGMNDLYKLELAENKRLNEQPTIEHYKKYGVVEGDKLLLETAKGSFKKGQESRDKEIMELNELRECLCSKDGSIVCNKCRLKQQLAVKQ